MNEKPYSKREMDLKFSSLEHRLFNEEEGFLPRIEGRVIYTNGQVRLHSKVLIAVVALLAGYTAANPSMIKLLISLL